MVCFIIANYIRFVHATGRWTEVRGDIVEPFMRDQNPFLYTFWHGRLLMMPYGWRTKMPLRMLISQHRDGAIIAESVAHFGLGTVRGSAGSKKGSDKNKGGAAAVRQMVRSVREGKGIGITPDGPAGPFMRASDGVAAVAKLSGVPIIPATYSTSRRRVMGSWDRFCLALPFTKGVIVWGEPIWVDRKADAEELERVRLEVEKALNDITREADELMGVEPIQPPPLVAE